jgi:hypothetical protein
MPMPLFPILQSPNANLDHPGKITLGQSKLFPDGLYRLSVPFRFHFGYPRRLDIFPFTGPDSGNFFIGINRNPRWFPFATGYGCHLLNAGFQSFKL